MASVQPPDLSAVSAPSTQQVQPEVDSRSTLAPELNERALRDFLRGISQLQGQLPPSLSDKQQALLRQMTTLLTAVNSPLPASNANPSPSLAGHSLQGLLPSLIAQLPADDPQLRQLMTQIVTPLLPGSSRPDNSALTSAITNLPATLQPGTESGRALWNWLAQLITLKLPTPPAGALQHQLQQNALTVQSTPPQAQPMIRQALEMTVKFIADVATGVRNGTAAPVPSSVEGHVLDTRVAATTQDASAKASISAQLAPPSTVPSTQEQAIEVTKNPAPTAAPLTERPQSVNDADAEHPLQTTALSKLKVDAVTAQPTAASTLAMHSHDDAATPSTNEQSTPSTALKPQGDYLHQLGVMLLRKQLPPALLAGLSRVLSAITPQIQTAQQVSEWLTFVQNPVLGNTSHSQAIQQWAIALLSYRLQRWQAESTQEQQPSRTQVTTTLEDGMESSSGAHKTAAHFLQQMERLQATPQESNSLLLFQVPLPPHYPGGKENHMALKQQRNEQGKYQWTLSFMLDLEHMGMLQIKALLDLPQVQLQMVAERRQTYERIKQTWPKLESRFRELGLSPAQFVCKQGKVQAVPETDAQPPDGFSIRV